jgi:hypothetical protein
MLKKFFVFLGIFEEHLKKDKFTICIRSQGHLPRSVYEIDFTRSTVGRWLSDDTYQTGKIILIMQLYLEAPVNLIRAF